MYPSRCEELRGGYKMSEYYLCPLEHSVQLE